MQYTGLMKKMLSSIDGETINYALPLGDEAVPLNELIGSPVKLSFADEIRCVACGRKTKKSFSQGHCFPCMRSLARCDTCIVKPELCHFHNDTCREPDWAEENCFTDHIVYLSNTSGLKIGITRGTQIPTRWVDQGAVAALPIYRVSSRRIAGLLEHPSTAFVADKTNWRAMLKGEVEPMDLISRRDELKPQIEEIVQQIREEHSAGTIETLDETVREFNYPVQQYPTKIVSHNLDKTGEAAGTLMGIKGQYLIMDTGVINIRKYTGYIIEFEGG